MSAQDGIVFIIVAGTAGIALRHGYLKYVRRPLAEFLLKRGRVGLAMRVRNGRKSGKKKGVDGGSDCGCD